ncbi:MAG: hypothetical protein JW729_07530 [Bacteroidales bacterium]|nr:hypothetical protein [Bacteroidales bacterium]
MNNIKEDNSPNISKAKTKKSFAAKYIKPMLDGSFLSKETSSKELPFIAFILLLIILFISNTFVAQNTVRSINNYKQQVKELRIKSIAVKARLMDNTRQTQIANKVKKLGLHESLTPPKKIFIEKEK